MESESRFLVCRLPPSSNITHHTKLPIPKQNSKQVICSSKFSSIQWLLPYVLSLLPSHHTSLKPLSLFFKVTHLSLSLFLFPVAYFWCRLKEASAKWAGGLLRLRELWPPAFRSRLPLSPRNLCRLPKVSGFNADSHSSFCWVLLMLCSRRRNLGSGFERLPYKAEGYNYWTWRGHKIHYVVQGEGSPIVLIHGFGASAFHWRFFFFFFSAFIFWRH